MYSKAVVVFWSVMCLLLAYFAASHMAVVAIPVGLAVLLVLFKAFALGSVFWLGWNELAGMMLWQNVPYWACVCLALFVILVNHFLPRAYVREKNPPRETAD